MANWYVSNLASGGAGSEGDPWDFITMVSKLNDVTIGAGDNIYVKADGTYTWSTTPIITSAGSLGAHKRLIGYTNTILDGGQVTLQLTASDTHVLSANVNYYNFENFIFDGNSNATTACLFPKASIIKNCIFKNSLGAGAYGTSCSFYDCVSYNNATYGYYNIYTMSFCLAYNNNIGMYRAVNYINCVSANNTTTNFETWSGTHMINCISYGGTGNGIVVNRYGYTIINCEIVNAPAGKQGILFGGYAYDGVCDYCNFSGNDSDTDVETALTNKKTLTPTYTDAGNYDFTRTTNTLDDQGKSTIGSTLYSYDYHISIGVDQRELIFSAPIFPGIIQLEAVGGGCLRATWAPATNHTGGYNIYVKASNDTNLFTLANLKIWVDNGSTEVIFRTDSDNASFLTNTQDYYVGVRAENGGTEETNVISLNISINGDGATYLKMDDIIGINLK